MRAKGSPRNKRSMPTEVMPQHGLESWCGWITYFSANPKLRLCRLLPRLLIRIDGLAVLQLRRVQDPLGRRVLELLQVVALHVLELHLQHPRLGPLATRS